MASNTNKKYESSASTCTTEGSSGSSSPSSPVNASNSQQPTNNAPKYGTLVPNRIFVGGISGNTTETELAQLFSAYGNVKATKVISDRAGVSKGYGFVTFETEEEAKRLMKESDCIVLKERKLNIAPAIKKQPFSRSYEVSSPPTVPNNTVYYQNGMPYTFHNGMAYFAPSTPPQATASSAMGGAGDPSAMYQTAYVQPTPTTGPAAAAAAAAAASYPVIYPCAAQPVFMSQQFPFQPMPPQAQNSQYMYTSTTSPTNGASGGGAPPTGTPISTLAPQHYYSSMSPSDMFYNIAPGQTYGTLVTTAPDGIVYETLPANVDAPNSISAEENSTNSGHSDLQRNGENNKADKESPSSNCVAQPENVISGPANSSQAAPPVSTGNNNPATPPVVSLLKLQTQGGEEAEGEQPLRSASAPYTTTPPPGGPSSSAVQQFPSGTSSTSPPLMPVVYHPVMPIGNPSLGSPLYMNQHLGYPPFVPPVFGEQFQPFAANGTSAPHSRHDKRGPNTSYQSKHFVDCNNPVTIENNDKNNAPFPMQYHKRPFPRNGHNNFVRDNARFNSTSGGRFIANGPSGNPRHPFPNRYNGPPNMRGGRRHPGNHMSYPVGRSSPPTSFAPVNSHVPDMPNSISPQFHPGARQIYYQPANPNNVASHVANGNTGGSGAGGGGPANGPHVPPRRHVGSRKSANMNGGRASGSNAANSKYSRVSVNGVQAFNSAKLAVLDKGGAGDAPTMMPITPPSTPHVSDSANAAVQEACHEMQALAL